ncbi:hypothetical protein SADUNF_Sadunf16G0169400 [Salix dunnii]|uniref:Amidase domain-containing protein n=1 Tax=Salix dunnii TaxID=1413687 RepID=A0A835JAD4_9ROSI|nr:hypothetical protein SADUNF_Sadunf16G0169400 [Salix dunnii]
MGKKRVMVPAADVDLSAVKYQNEAIQDSACWSSDHITFEEGEQDNSVHKCGTDVVSMNALTESETGVVVVDEDGKPEDRVELAMKCLPPYNAASSWNEDLASSFRYWKIRDYAHAYRSKFVTPSMVAEQIIPVIEEFNKKDPPMPLLISFDAEEVRKQAAASTKRFEEGSPISILDGIFIAIKDDIDLYPHPSKGATTWMHEVRPVEEDAISVSRLRSCGVIFVGKANMHEFGMGTTGNNPNYGTTRNPHAVDRYTGGSSSGPAAIVASGLCSAALGTDGGGSIRIPSSLCGVVGLKTTFGRTNITGSLYDFGTVEVIGPIASSVEDVMLVYAAILGSRPEERISLNPSPPCLPNLSSRDGADALGSLRLGKYTAWFNDVQSTNVSDTCEDMLNLLSRTHGCEMVEIVIPELQEMRTAHLVSIGSEFINSLIPEIEDGKGVRLNHDSRTNVRLFRSFRASDYIAAQCLRSTSIAGSSSPSWHAYKPSRKETWATSFVNILWRRLMYHHMEIFKKVDVIVTPTTGMTAPEIPSSALSYGETDLQTTGYLMRFIIAANLLGFPAISIPVGYDKQGLPIGLQLIGRPWGEATLLRLASAVEELYAKPKKRPASFYDVLKTK